MRGIANHDRIDAELYQDHETDDARRKREARQAKERDKAAKAAARAQGGTAAASAAAAAAAAAASVQAAQNAQNAQRSAGAQYYRVTVRDNGAGMPHDDIPDMLGRVLSGTKYGVRQTRGKFGLGAKMALIWSKMTTGLPFEIRAATEGSAFVSRYVLDIDIHRNEPTVHHVSKEPQGAGGAGAGAGAGGAAGAGAAATAPRWRGAELSVTIEGNWTKYRSYVLKYLRQIAVITPYAQFAFTFVPERAGAAAAARGAPPAGTAGAAPPPGSLRLLFKRRTDAMPPPPAVTRHHPSSVDLEQVKRLLADTRAPTMAAFLAREFDAVDKPLALRLLGELRSCGLKADGDPQKATAAQAARLHHLLREARFRDPSGAHLSPAGEYNLRLGVMKELNPELIATHQGDVRVFEGHAFVVEAAVSVGGRDMKPGINVHRFANRIPLLFEAGSDVVTRTATKRVNWASYKINQVSCGFCD
jgi:DNA topoisomerase VI subunit B